MVQSISTNTELFFKIALDELKIDENRTKILQSIAILVVQEIKKNSNINLNYICTNNSIRSQLAQVWSSYATNYFKLLLSDKKSINY